LKPCQFKTTDNHGDNKNNEQLTINSNKLRKWSLF